MRCEGVIGCSRFSKLRLEFERWPDWGTSLRSDIRPETAVERLDMAVLHKDGLRQCSAAVRDASRTKSERIGKQILVRGRHGSPAVNRMSRQVARACE